jgi:rhodanese-related sulfurtransferase
MGNIAKRIGWIVRQARLMMARSEGTEVEGVTAEELRSWLADGRPVQLVDIRGEAAYREGHLAGARHLPVERLAEARDLLDVAAVTVVY